jgi:CrcB protein
LNGRSACECGRETHCGEERRDERHRYRSGSGDRRQLALQSVDLGGAALGGVVPYGTLIVNVIGSFAIGVVLVLATTRLNLSDPARLLIVTGLLGGFTTFSSLSFETYSLITNGSWLAAGIYVISSFGLGIASVFLGAGIARLLP